MPDRPVLSPTMSGSDLRRWYWLRSELADLARLLDIDAGGGKLLLTDRLVAALDGRTPPPSPTRHAAGRQLTGALTPETVIPVGQRCGQVLRAFFVAQLGPTFRFDGPMRSFVAENAGATLGDAVEHWHSTRDRAPAGIGEQFEINRFTRQWHLDHPGGARADLLAAWSIYRNTPTDRRPRA